jgi:hypothetical protein
LILSFRGPLGPRRGRGRRPAPRAPAGRRALGALLERGQVLFAKEERAATHALSRGEAHDNVAARGSGLLMTLSEARARARSARRRGAPLPWRRSDVGPDHAGQHQSDVAAELGRIVLLREGVAAWMAHTATPPTVSRGIANDRPPVAPLLSDEVAAPDRVLEHGRCVVVRNRSRSRTRS